MYMEEDESSFYSLEKESKENAIKTKKERLILIGIILFLIFLVVLVILVRRNLEISIQKKPSLITISTNKTDTFSKNTEIEVEYILMPDHIDSTDLIWHSSNEEVATFIKDNILKTLSIGQTTIYTELSGVKSNELNIIVGNFLEDVNIINIPKQLTVNKSLELEVELLPADSVNTTIKIESSDDKILTVRERIIMAISPGEVTLTIKDKFNNILRNYEIQVIPEAEKVNKNQ